MSKLKLEQLNYQKKTLHSKIYYKHKAEDLMIAIDKDSVHLIQRNQDIELSFDEVEAIHDETQLYKHRIFLKNERYQQGKGLFLTIQKVSDTTIFYILDGEDVLKSFDKDSVFARTLKKLK